MLFVHVNFGHVGCSMQTRFLLEYVLVGVGNVYFTHNCHLEQPSIIKYVSSAKYHTVLTKTVAHFEQYIMSTYHFTV